MQSHRRSFASTGLSDAEVRGGAEHRVLQFDRQRLAFASPSLLTARLQYIEVLGGGISPITVGIARQGFDLQFPRCDERGWRATFYTTGM